MVNFALFDARRRWADWRDLYRFAVREGLGRHTRDLYRRYMRQYAREYANARKAAGNGGR